MVTEGVEVLESSGGSVEEGRAREGSCQASMYVLMVSCDLLDWDHFDLTAEPDQG